MSCVLCKQHSLDVLPITVRLPLGEPAGERAELARQGSLQGSYKHPGILQAQERGGGLVKRQSPAQPTFLWRGMRQEAHLSATHTCIHRKFLLPPCPANILELRLTYNLFSSELEFHLHSKKQSCVGLDLSGTLTHCPSSQFCSIRGSG